MPATTFMDDIAEQGRRIALLEQAISNPAVIGSTPANATFTTVTIDSGTGAVQVLAAPVSPPTGMGITTGAYLNNLWATITWTAPADASASQYEIRVAKKISGVYQPPKIYRQQSTTLRVEGLDPLATYGVIVFSLNNVNRLSAPLPSSGWQDFTTTTDTTIPAAPTGVAVTQGIGSITLSWNENTEPDVVGGKGLYEYDYSTSSTFASGVTTERVNATITSITGLAAGPTWYFRVRAIDSSGNASVSSTPTVSTAVGTFASDGSAPPAVGGVTVTSLIGAIYIKWAEVVSTDIVSYDVHLSTTSGFTPSGATLVGTVTDGTSYLLKTLPGSATALSYDTVYYIKVIARDVDGSAAPSTQVSGSMTKTAFADIGLDLVGSLNQKLYDTGQDATRWNFASGTLTNVTVTDALSGNTVHSATNSFIGDRKDLVPYDPETLYRIKFRVRQTVADSLGTRQNVYLGLTGWSDQTTRVNATGSNTISSQHYIAAAAVPLVTGVWTTFTAYVKGLGSPNGTATPTGNSAQTPAKMHSSTKFISPVMYLNNASGDGTCQVDLVVVEALTDNGTVSTYYQSTAPAATNNLHIGDMWYDTANGNRASRWSGSAWVTQLVGSSGLNVAIGGGNMVVNSNVKAGLLSYSPYFGGVVTYDTTTGRQTNNSYLVTTNSNTVPQGVIAYAPLNESVPGSSKVTVSAYVKGTAGLLLKIGLRCLTPGTGTSVAEPTVDASEITCTGGWDRLVYTYTGHASPFRVGVQILTTNRSGALSYPAIGTTFNVTDIQAELGDMVTAYAPRPDEILPNTITVTEIADNAITTPKLIAGAITTAKIAAGAVTANEIAALSITAAKIVAGTITATQMATGTITAASGIIGSLDAAVITTGTLAAGRIASKSITTEKLTIANWSDSALVNGSFEDAQAADPTKPANWGSSAGWIVLGTGGAWALDTTNGNGGGNCLKITRGTSGDPVIYSDAIPVSPGQEWRVSTYHKASAASGYAAIFAYWGTTPNFNPGDAGVINAGMVGWFAPTTSYQSVDWNATVPAGVGYLRVGLGLNSNAAGTIVYFDDCLVKLRTTSLMLTDGAVTTAKIIATGIDASVIKFGTMSGDRITTNTLSAGAIKTGTLNAATITVGATGSIFVGDGVYGGTTIDANGIHAHNNYSGITGLDIDLYGNVQLSGTITASGMDASYITGGSIDGAVITGGMLRTAASGAAVLIDGTGGYVNTIWFRGYNAAQLDGYISGTTGPGTTGVGDLLIEPARTNTSGTGQPQIWMSSTERSNVNNGGFIQIESQYTNLHAIKQMDIGYYASSPIMYFYGQLPSSFGQRSLFLWFEYNFASLSSGASNAVLYTYGPTLPAVPKAVCSVRTGQDVISGIPATSTTQIQHRVKNIDTGSASPTSIIWMWQI